MFYKSNGDYEDPHDWAFNYFNNGGDCYGNGFNGMEGDGSGRGHGRFFGWFGEGNGIGSPDP